MTVQTSGRDVMAPGGCCIRSALEKAYLELIPNRTAAERFDQLPAGAWVGISCSPRTGIGPTLELVERLVLLHGERGLKPVPHIAARVIRDRAHLADVVARLGEAGVRAVLVPGGDSRTPAGDYGSALELLRDMAEIGHPFAHVGVAAHPEGHPFVSREELLRALLDKQEYATYFVTQMCFDSDVIVTWLREIRRSGVTLHAWPGLPGVLEIPKLLAMSLRIGVGRSVNMLKKQKGLARNLLGGRSYRPDALLEGLRPALLDPVLGIYGFHLFCFNNVAATERWRLEALAGAANPEN